MKNVMFLFVLFASLILILNFTSAVTIETKDNYSLGESFIARISGNFYTPLAKSNIHFYRNNVSTSFEPFYLDKIDEDYYVSFGIPPEKVPGSYTVRLEDVKYFSGNNLIDDPVSKNFIITNKTAFVLVNPPLKIPENYSYNLSLKNIFPERINLSYNAEGQTEKFIIINSGQVKNITLNNYGGNEFQNVFFNYAGETYSSVVYVNLPEIPGGPVSNETNEDDEEVV
ncbi:MAG: hypothetical protein Q8Q04_02555, partial [archaeon]|nr:hypothetical protein [archaeon]